MADSGAKADVGTIQLPRDILNMAKTISAHEGVTMTAVIVRVLRPAIERRYRRTITAAAELAALHAPVTGGEGGA